MRFTVVLFFLFFLLQSVNYKIDIYDNLRSAKEKKKIIVA